MEAVWFAILKFSGKPESEKSFEILSIGNLSGKFSRANSATDHGTEYKGGHT